MRIDNVIIEESFRSGYAALVERNSHCDVLHIAPVRVANLVLDCNGVFAIKAYAVSGSRCARGVIISMT